MKEVNGEIEHVKANVSGVYFIYLLEKDGTYSLLYIGEATSIRTRLEKHRVKSMEEKNKPNEYSLRRKILIESGLNI